MRISLSPPEKGFSSLADQMGRWLDRVLGPDYNRFSASAGWKPSINLYEDVSAMYIAVDLAGVHADAIDLRVEGGLLVLAGERPGPRPEQVGPAPGPLRVHLMEIDHGPFHRTVKLPETIDADRIEAGYRNGFLWVCVPKKG